MVLEGDFRLNSRGEAIKRVDLGPDFQKLTDFVSRLPTRNLDWRSERWTFDMPCVLYVHRDAE